MAAKKKGILHEFKEFALKGNMFDLAVGVIIGGAFKGLVDSLTNQILMPIISMFTGGVNFSAWKLTLGTKQVDGNWVANELLFGDFISAVLNFLIMALVVFLMVKAINRVRTLGKKEEASPASAEPTKEEKLLTEIRDLLKK